MSNEWWKRSEGSAVADRPADDWFDDFDFDDDEGGDRFGGLWTRYGGRRSTDDAERVARALRLVQGFVDTFATGDKRYGVTFDESVKTAGTSFTTRQVVISHRPLFDSTIDAETAETVLTAMAAHEASHVRYGRSTATAVAKAFPANATAARVSNVLDDVRIETRFAEDYPGYADVFGPAVRYVAESELRTLGAERFDAGALGAFGRLVGAARYDAHVDWSGHEAERDRWADWARRGSATDSPRDHVAAVREALQYLDEETEDQPQTPTCDGHCATQGHGHVAETGAAHLPECPADAVDDAAAQNDGASRRLDAGQAQRAADVGRNVVRGADHIGNDYDGEVYYGPRNVSRRRVPVEPDGSASSAIRAAFARSRTGHYARERNLKAGRLDSRALSRCASTDLRIFARRQAQSEGHYFVRVMVDCSGSMGGTPIADAMGVAAALAAASRHVPTLRLEVWGWTNGWKVGGDFGAVRVWQTGDPVGEVGWLGGLRMIGTPDREMFAWAARSIREDARPGEQPLLVIASDGMGSLYHDGQGADAVNEARRKGVGVVSVALGQMSEHAQRSLYGDHGFVAWRGSVRAMARPVGELLARVVSGRRMA